MEFSLKGVPIHSRALQVTLREAGPGSIAFDGGILDLRKRGFVPVGGDLQGAGIIHQMQVAGTIDEPSGTIATIAARMPTVAFEASPATAGESCRDLVGNVESLAGTPLEDGFGRRVGGEIGGPRGCSHVLTLVHLLGPTAAWALRADARILGGASGRRPARRDGERLFRRDLVVDGWATEQGELALVLQLGTSAPSRRSRRRPTASPANSNCASRRRSEWPICALRRSRSPSAAGVPPISTTPCGHRAPSVPRPSSGSRCGPGSPQS